MRSALALCLLWTGASLAGAPPAPATAAEPNVKVKGAIPKPLALTQNDLEALGASDETWTTAEGAHQIHGVRLSKVLDAAGFSPGASGRDVPKTEKRAGWKMALRVTGADGYQTIFSCAELAEAMGPTRAYLVWQVDGGPVRGGRGPFRIVVLTDRESARSVQSVTTLEVLDLRS
jgi:hypothetical protein